MLARRPRRLINHEDDCYRRRAFEFRGVVPDRARARAGGDFGGGARADDGFAQSDRTIDPIRRGGLRGEHRVRENGVCADFARANWRVAGESGAQPCVRSGRAAERAGNASDAGAAGQCDCQGIFGRAAGGGGNAVRDAEQERAAGDSFAGIGRRVGRFGAAGAFGPGSYRRRRSDFSGPAHPGRRSDEGGDDYAAGARSERRPGAAEWDAGDAGVAVAGAARSGNRGEYGGRGGGVVLGCAARKPGGV